jgi:hypothetical protein
MPGAAARTRLWFWADGIAAFPQHAHYSQQKRCEAEFIDSKGVSADLAKTVAAADMPIKLHGPNLGQSFEDQNSRLRSPVHTRGRVDKRSSGKPPERPMKYWAPRCSR